MDFVLENSKMIIKPVGKIIMTNSDATKKVVKSLIDSHEFEGLAMDLSNIEYVDSTGIGVFISIYKYLAERNRKMALIAPQSKVGKVIKITKLETIVPVIDHIDELLC